MYHPGCWIRTPCKISCSALPVHPHFPNRGCQIIENLVIHWLLHAKVYTLILYLLHDYGNIAIIPIWQTVLDGLAWMGLRDLWLSFSEDNVTRFLTKLFSWTHPSGPFVHKIFSIEILVLNLWYNLLMVLWWNQVLWRGEANPLQNLLNF